MKTNFEEVVKMFKANTGFWMLVSLMFGCMELGLAAVPDFINYQGRVLKSSAPFTKANCNFLFAVVCSSDTDTYIWTNDGSTPPSTPVTVDVKDGNFNVKLGSDDGMEPLTASVFSNSELSLRVWFNENSTPDIEDDELTPAQELACVGYSFKAGSVDDGSITNAKLASDADSLSKVTAGTMTVSAGNVGIGTTPGAKLDVKSNAVSNAFLRGLASDGDILFYFMEDSSGYGALRIYDNDNTLKIQLSGNNGQYSYCKNNFSVGTDVPLGVFQAGNTTASSLIVESGGNVGIGVDNASYKLDVDGSINGASYYESGTRGISSEEIRLASGHSEAWSGGGLSGSWADLTSVSVSSSYEGMQILIYGFLGLFLNDSYTTECRITYDGASSGTGTEIDKTWCQYKIDDSGSHYLSYTVNSIFTVPAGGTTLRIQGKRSGGTNSVQNYDLGYIIISR